MAIAEHALFGIPSESIHVNYQKKVTTKTGDGGLVA